MTKRQSALSGMGRFFELQSMAKAQSTPLWRTFYHDEWQDYAEVEGLGAVTEAVDTVLAEGHAAIGNPIHEIISGALKGANYVEDQSEV